MVDKHIALSRALQAALVFIIDGGGSVIALGEKGHLVVPFNCVATAVELEADQNGAVVIDIWKSTYAGFPPVVGGSICGGAKPTIPALSQKSKDTTLVGWTTALSQYDILAFNVDSATTITRVTLTLHVTKS
jgi:hypothetical protein